MQFKDEGENIMKLQLFAALALATPLIFTSTVNAGNSQDLQKLNLTRECVQCDLSGVNLRGAHLIGADLRGANLSGANLEGVNLEGADLTNANLKGANLTSAMLTNVNFKAANLNGANLTRAQIYDANVYGASMDDMIITDAEIYHTGIGIGGEEADMFPDWDQHRRAEIKSQKSKVKRIVLCHSESVGIKEIAIGKHYP